MFNGGRVEAHGSYHGAGVGGGYKSGSGTLLASGIACPENQKAGPGNITINGGELYAYGKEHGNGFGRACPGTSGTLYYDMYTIQINGGTVLPSAGYNQYSHDLGASKFHSKGADANLIITGGSLRVNTASQYGFDGTPYGPDGKTKVFMTVVDLKAEGLDGCIVSDMKFSVGGVPLDFGLPSIVDDKGCLYFWLPQNDLGLEVKAELTIKDKNGNDIHMEPFYVTNAQHGDKLKRYVEFDVPEDIFGEKGVSNVKRYDGLAFASPDISNMGITSPDSDQNKPIDDNSKITWQSQRMNEEGELGDEHIESGLPKNVGQYNITMTSTQYSEVTGFKESYWGHRGYYSPLTITFADSHTDLDVTIADDNSNGKIDAIERTILTATVRPADGEALTCESPTGKVQFYLNGQPLGEPVDLVPATNGSAPLVTPEGYQYSTAALEWSPRDDANNITPADEYVITAEYLGGVPGVNYTASDAQGDDPVEIIPGESGIPITITDVTDPADRIDVTGDEVTRYIDEPLTLEFAGGNDKVDFVYTYSDPDILEVDPVTGQVTYKGCGTVVITATRPGTAGVLEQSESVTVHILPRGDGTTGPAGPSVQKGVVNKTDADKPTQVNDILTYTIRTENKLAGSVWENVVITDVIPRGLTLLTDSLQMTKPDGTTVALPASCYDEQTHILTIEVGDVAGGELYIFTFDVQVNGDALVPDQDGKPADIGNSVKAEGDGGLGDSDGPVYPNDWDKPDNGGVSRVDALPSITKTAVNQSRTDDEAQVTDRITYTITVENRQQGSVWRDVAIRDQIPLGLQIDTDSMYLTKPDGTVIHLDPAVYDEAQRLLSVYVGNVQGGEKYILTFDAILTAEATDNDIGNIAMANTNGAGGTPPSNPGGGSGGPVDPDNPGGGGTDPDPDNPGGGSGTTPDPDNPGDPYFPAGDDPFDDPDDVIDTEPVYPEGREPDSPGPLPTTPATFVPILPTPTPAVPVPTPTPSAPADDLTVDKNVSNKTGPSNSVRYDDILAYEITLHNPKLGSTWRNVMIFDYLPKELVVDPDSMVLIAPNGTRTKADPGCYNPQTRMICVPVAQIAGGETYTLQYDVAVMRPEQIPGTPDDQIVNYVELGGDDPDGKPIDPGRISATSLIPYPKGQTPNIPNTGDTAAATSAAAMLLAGLCMLVLLVKKARKAR